MNRVLTAILACVAVIPSVAFAVTAARTYSELVDQLVSLMNAGVAVLVALGVAIYFYGMYSNILKFGEDNPEKKKAFFFWGIIILFVMVSIWGILQIMQNTLFPPDGSSNQAQQLTPGQREA
ncbi:MAG: hypothetical protein AAB899_00860 [Patescibacteria group bacterium]